MSLHEGQNAPDFSAIADNGESMRLSEIAAKFIILYFYPKDDTPGCTLEACGLRDRSDELGKYGAIILGVGKGTKGSHKKFKEKYHLDFPLLVDTELLICAQYDVLKDKSMFGKPYKSIARTTYVIQNMKIIKVFEDVNPVTHAGALIEFLQSVHA